MGGSVIRFIRRRWPLLIPALMLTCFALGDTPPNLFDPGNKDKLDAALREMAGISDPAKVKEFISTRLFPGTTVITPEHLGALRDAAGRLSKDGLNLTTSELSSVMGPLFGAGDCFF